MPKKNAKVQKTNELDGREFFAAIDLIEKEKGIPKAYMLDKITQALVSAYKRDHEGAGDNVSVEADEEAGTVRMFVKKDVVEEVDNPCTEMSLEMARSKLPQAQLGDVIRIEIKTRDFGRIAAQTARQVIIQGMREAERGMIYDEFSSKEHEILTGVVTRIDPRSGAASLRIGSGNEATEAFLAPGEQVKGETYTEGMRLRVYVVEVRRSTKGPQVLISRTHPGLVKRLFELEVPEIYDGTVEVKSIAREAGSRTKLAVWSADPDVDAIIGTCDVICQGAVYAVLQSGKPIELFSMDTNEAWGYARSTISYMDLNHTEMGDTAASILYSLICGDGNPDCRIIIPHTLHPAESTFLQKAEPAQS